MIQKNRLVETFLELVQIDSPSGEEKEISKLIAAKLNKLGGATEFDSYGNIIARFDGVGIPCMLNAHLDTVDPGRGIKPHVTGEKITSDGTTILGADDKAGLAIIIETLASLVEENKSHVPLEIVLTLGEEVGLLGAVNLDYSKVKAKIGVTFDMAGGVENITTAAPGYARVDVTVTGRSAHAGFEPEKGISAIKIISEIISQLEVGRIDDETTANVGLIEGGSARNAVPETAHFKAEIRSRNLKKLEGHKLHFEKVLKDVLLKHPDAKIDLNSHTEFDPYLFKESYHVIQRVVKTLKKMGLEPHLVPSGGGADVNIFHKHGIETLCIGAGFYNPHTTREYVLIHELVNGAKFCEKFVLTD